MKPNARILELAQRLVAAGPKCCAVSASECHEITDFILKCDEADAQNDSARLEWIEQACQGYVRGTDIPRWEICGTSETDDDLRAVIDRTAKSLGHG